MNKKCPMLSAPLSNSTTILKEISGEEKMIKTLAIKIKSLEQEKKEFIQAFKAAQAGKFVKPTRGTYFTSLDAVRSVLTEQRLALLHLIKEHHPKSIYALAKLAKRDFKNVHDDVMLLKRWDILKITKEKRKSNAKPHHRANVISVPYQAIQIQAYI